MKFLASIKITVTCLALLFILTFWGTIDQVSNGLYHAQEKFFHSWGFLAFGFIPFPGAQLVLWILFINLLSVAVTRFVYSWSHVGILLIHLGLLSYFVAAFVTFQLAQESNLTLAEGTGSNVSAAYHDWEISFWFEEEGKRSVTAVDANDFKSGQIFSLPEIGLQLEVLTYFRNSQAYTSSQKSDALAIMNDSGIESLTEIAPSIEPEKNLPGGIFRLSASRGILGDLLLYGGETGPSQIRVGKKMYYAQLRRKKFSLPFVLKLIDFKMEQHPNTEIARSYESLVEIIAPPMTRQVLISMNKPLRFQDVTFYQASYAIDALGRQFSTLAVVKNPGRLLPYFASLITFMGLVVHFLFVMLSRGGKQWK